MAHMLRCKDVSHKLDHCQPDVAGDMIVSHIVGEAFQSMYISRKV